MSDTLTNREQPSQAALEALLRRWISLASLQHRVLTVLSSELTHTSSDVENEVVGLSGRFQEIATAVRWQNDKAQTLGGMAGLTKGNLERAERVAAESDSLATEIMDSIAGIVMGLQFQDRAKQRMEHVVDTLAVLADALQGLQHESGMAMPGGIEPDLKHEIVWLENLLSRYTLGEMRRRFVARLLEGDYKGDMAPAHHAETADTDGGSIDLF